MLELLKLLCWMLPASLALVSSAASGAVAIILGIPMIEKLALHFLMKLFYYTAKLMNSSQRISSKEEITAQNKVQIDPLIQRDIVLSQNGMRLSDVTVEQRCGTYLHLPAYFVKAGVEAIIEDEVTQRFSSAELNLWNLLSRTARFESVNVRVRIICFIGAIVRYCVLLPVRILVASSAVFMLAIMCFGVSCLPKTRLQRYLYGRAITFSFRLFLRGFSSVITFHNAENKPKSDGICVANHTSPIDVVVLGCDNVYALVGQKHGGFIGFMETVFSRGESHIWFERSETRDRQIVAQRIREHVENPDKLPILVFPEGTCINNTSVMMFKKGSFEVGGVIYPVAIKYDSLFADCFWDSSRHSMVRHLFNMMTSWAIKADVWYLPPQKQLPNENSIQFANRVKKEIALQGGLVDLGWDGSLKRSKPKDTFKFAQQDNFFNFIKEA